MIGLAERETLNVKVTDTVEELKKKIKDKMKISARHQQLFYGGKILADWFTLSYYGIHQDATLHLL